MRLDLYDLRKANVERQAEWSPEPTPLLFRTTELAGEVGVACNVIKKLERERLGIRGSRDTLEHAGEELADVIICVDLVAQSLGINLSDAVVRKFNQTSDKVGLKTYLYAAAVEQDTQNALTASLKNRHKDAYDGFPD